MKNVKSILTAAILSFGLSSAATVSFAADTDRNHATYAEDHKKHKQSKRDRNHGQRLQKMLKAVDASDAQTSNIKGIAQSYKGQLKAQKQSKRELRKAIKQLDPMAGNYDAEINKYAQQAADLARNKVILKANMRRDIAQQLTAEQRATLKAKRLEKMEKRSNR